MFKLSNLNYEYDKLEPHIDAQTMEIHHSKHHDGYTNKLNDAISGTQFENWPIEKILKSIGKIPENIRQSVINNGGGFHNHNLFFEILSPYPHASSEKFRQLIKENFVSLEKLEEKLINSGLSRFGSGWVFICFEEKNPEKLEVLTTKNQDSPLMENKIPILGIDVWEHAYYLKYQNQRKEYLKNVLKIIDFSTVEKIYNSYL